MINERIMLFFMFVGDSSDCIKRTSADPGWIPVRSKLRDIIEFYIIFQWWFAHV